MATNFGFGALVTLGLYLINIPNPVLWGFLAGAFRFVPYLGPMLGALLPATLSFAVSPGWAQPLEVVGVVISLDLLASMVIEPALFGSHTGISPLALLVSAAFWTVLWGTPGLMLSTPLTVCVVILGQYIPSLFFLHVLLGDQAALPVDVLMYQRLLAGDLTDARTMARNLLKSMTLMEFYDNVAIPSLKLGEEDRSAGILGADRWATLCEHYLEIIADVADWADGLDGEKAEDAQFALGRVLCLPARNEGDVAVCMMLAQIMERRGAGVITLPGEVTMSEIATIDLQPEDVIVVSALSTYTPRTRRLIRELSRQSDGTIVIEARWQRENDPVATQEGTGSTTGVIVHSIASVVREIERHAQTAHGGQ